MQLIIDNCCNPLGVQGGSHDINVAPITEEQRRLFSNYLGDETHTCLICRLKLLQEIWLVEPERLDSTIMAIVKESEDTIKTMERTQRIKAANNDDCPCR